MLLHTSLYRALKLTYPMDAGCIVLNGWMISEMGMVRLGQSIGVLTSTDFYPVYE